MIRSVRYGVEAECLIRGKKVIATCFRLRRAQHGVDPAWRYRRDRGGVGRRGCTDAHSDGGARSESRAQKTQGESGESAQRSAGERQGSFKLQALE